MTLFVLVGIPLGVVGYQAHRTGMTWSQVVGRMFGGGETGTGSVPDNALPKGEKVDFLVSESIGAGFTTPPKISYVQAVDLDQDDLLDVLVCDCEANQLSWIRQYPQGTFTEKALFNRPDRAGARAGCQL